VNPCQFTLLFLRYVLSISNILQGDILVIVGEITSFRTAKKPLILSDIEGLDAATDNSIKNYDITPTRIFSKRN